MYRNGLEKKDFSVSDRALEAVIDDYTSEAGVRNLERTLAKLMRKAAREISETGTKKVKVTAKNLEEYLGPPIIKNDISAKKDMVGVCNGMAWTSVGGVLLPIEATVIPGTGKLLLNGSLGEVMTESAKLAITFARTLGPEYKVPEKLMTEYDIHIHAPEGAVPKDGPSAGVTMATAILSALTLRSVRHDVAMTGEITLRGRVLPIGGLREKTMAAYRNRITTVLIPRENEADLADVDPVVREAIRFIPVKTADEVFAAAICPEVAQPSETAPPVSTAAIPAPEAPERALVTS
jgi:ATP-dependent Lon protease